VAGWLPNNFPNIFNHLHIEPFPARAYLPKVGTALPRRKGSQIRINLTGPAGWATAADENTGGESRPDASSRGQW